MSAGDRTIAWDDLVCQRVTRCGGCGRWAEHLDLAFVAMGNLVVLAAQCVRCRAADPSMQELLARVEQRYGQSNGETG